MNGIIFFEDGTVAQFGKLVSVQRIVMAIQETVPQLIQQERNQLLATITQDELKLVVDKLAIAKENE